MVVHLVTRNLKSGAEFFFGLSLNSGNLILLGDTKHFDRHVFRKKREDLSITDASSADDRNWRTTCEEKSFTGHGEASIKAEIPPHRYRI